MRTVGLVTSARSDWGLQRTVAEALQLRSDVDLQIIACGMHLSREFDFTVDQIIEDGFEVAHRVESLRPGDTPEAIADSMGRGVSAFASLFGEWRPDLLTVLGDRFDMFPAVVAAQPFLIPIAHMHGGEITRGAMDDSLRHAMTKMCHIHLASTRNAAERILQMGEDPDNVYVVGAPGLDDLIGFEPLDEDELCRVYGFSPDGLNVLVAYHPETRAYQGTQNQVEALLDALERFDANVVFVRSNADTANAVILQLFENHVAHHDCAVMPNSMPRRTFLSLMKSASVMIGNSSAGLIETPMFCTPTVNIGSRQEGRERAANVIDCEATASGIQAALAKALTKEFLASLAGLQNPYGDGHSGPRIAKIIAELPIGEDLINKRFVGR